jgi:hypothetical protein
MGELTQLRGADVVNQAIKLTPEAGTMKSRKPRTVPLHEHLIEQGFLDFVKASGAGPLFYNEPKQRRRRRTRRAEGVTAKRAMPWPYGCATPGAGINCPAVSGHFEHALR